MPTTNPEYTNPEFTNVHFFQSSMLWQLSEARWWAPAPYPKTPK